MTVQTSYDKHIGVSIAGAPYDLSDLEAMSYSVQGQIPYGSGVVYADSPTERERVVYAPSDEAPGFIGVLLRVHDTERKTTPISDPTSHFDGSYDYLGDKETASIATKGRVWVTVMEDVDAFDAALLHHDTSDNGAFGKTAGAGIRAAGSSIFLTSAAAGELAVLDIRV